MNEGVSSTEVGGADEQSFAVLRFVDGDAKGQEVAVGEAIVIGRDPGCDVVLGPSAKRASSRHASIRRAPTGFRVLEDLGSANGTFVNEQRLAAGTSGVLSSGDLVRFGDKGPTAQFLLRTREAGTHQRPGEGYAIALARAETLHGADRRLLWRDKPIITIGRDPGCDLVLPEHNKRVSGRHARIRFSGRDYQLEDLGGANGTFVNGERVTGSALHPGDVIELGAGGPMLVVESVEVPGQAESVDVATMQTALDRMSQQSRRTVLWIVIAVAVLLAIGGVVVFFVVRGSADELRAEVEAKDDESPPALDADTRFKELEKQHTPSVVLVRTQYRIVDAAGNVLVEDHAYGSGFFISTDGHVVTNRHVLEPWRADVERALELAQLHSAAPGKVSVERDVAIWPAGAHVFGPKREPDFASGFNTHVQKNLEIVGSPPERLREPEVQGLEIELLATDHTDLALLRAKGAKLSPEAIAPLLPSTEKPANQDNLLSLGFPEGDKLLEGTSALPSPARGEVRKVEETIQVGIAVYPGNSGGPVFDVDGRVIGVTTREVGPNLAMCIPARLIRTMIMHLGITVDLPR